MVYTDVRRDDARASSKTEVLTKGEHGLFRSVGNPHAHQLETRDASNPVPRLSRDKGGIIKVELIVSVYPANGEEGTIVNKEALIEKAICDFVDGEKIRVAGQTYQMIANRRRPR